MINPIIRIKSELRNSIKITLHAALQRQLDTSFSDYSFFFPDDLSLSIYKMFQGAPSNLIKRSINKTTQVQFVLVIQL